MHDRAAFEEDGWIGQSYVQRLRTFDVPVYMQKAYPDIPKSVAYPLGDVADLVKDYFGSTIAYMLALGIWFQYRRVDMWGFELSDDHDHQRPNVEYLIGFARGRGMEVNVHGEGVLQTLNCGYPVRYGWHGD